MLLFAECWAQKFKHIEPSTGLFQAEGKTQRRKGAEGCSEESRQSHLGVGRGEADRQVVVQLEGDAEVWRRVDVPCSPWTGEFCPQE